MKLTMKKVQQAGFSHVVLPLAFLAVGVGVVAFAGSRITGSSSAATVADICGAGYTKQGEHYLKNTQTGEQAHFKLIVGANGTKRCIFTMGTDAAANETNNMSIALYLDDDKLVLSSKHSGKYKSRTPVIKFNRGTLSPQDNYYEAHASAIRNGNTNKLTIVVR